MNYIIVFLILAIIPYQQDKTFKDILSPFSGHWKGSFKVFTYDGQLTDQIDVEQRYWWDGDIQKGVFIDRYTDGRIVKSQVTNFEENGILRCEVVKDNGEKSVHTGRYENGFLFWYRKSDDNKMVESFKERVIDTANGKEYQIDGFGIYGGSTHLLFEGRYKRIE